MVIRNKKTPPGVGGVIEGICNAVASSGASAAEAQGGDQGEACEGG